MPGWVSAYRSKLMVESNISELPERQQGRPLLIGKESESHVKETIQELQLANRTVNAAIILAIAKGYM